MGASRHPRCHPAWRVDIGGGGRLHRDRHDRLSAAYFGAPGSPAPLRNNPYLAIPSHPKPDHTHTHQYHAIHQHACQHARNRALLDSLSAGTRRASIACTSQATKLNNPHLLAVSHSFPTLQLSQPTCAGTQRSFHDS